MLINILNKPSEKEDKNCEKYLPDVTKVNKSMWN